MIHGTGTSSGLRVDSRLKASNPFTDVAALPRACCAAPANEDDDTIHMDETFYFNSPLRIEGKSVQARDYLPIYDTIQHDTRLTTNRPFFSYSQLVSRYQYFIVRNELGTQSRIRNAITNQGSQDHATSQPRDHAHERQSKYNQESKYHRYTAKAQWIIFLS